MQLSENFTLAEMTFSQTAQRRGINNTPSQTEINNLRRLCIHVLQPLRNHFQRPVIVTSGYRSPQLNKAIGGSQTSQHSKGEAADFTVSGIGLIQTCNYIAKNLPFDQLIYEFDSWIHVSYSGRNRRQLLTIDRRGTRNGIKGV